MLCSLNQRHLPDFVLGRRGRRGSTVNTCNTVIRNLYLVLIPVSGKGPLNHLECSERRAKKVSFVMLMKQLSECT